MSDPSSTDRLLMGATAGPWRLELHARPSATSTRLARLTVRNTETDENVLDEGFLLDYEPIFGVDISDMERAEVRAEEVIDAYEEGQANGNGNN
jgi:hypothetical protein